MDELGAFVHQSAFLDAVRTGKPTGEVELCVLCGEDAVRTELQFRRGPFQGDSLSPLLFCLSIAPISHALRKSKGFSMPYLGSPVTHLFFMDDLKVYAKNAKQLGAKLQVVDRVSRAVGMELGLRKCATAHVSHGCTWAGKIISWKRSRRLNA